MRRIRNNTVITNATVPTLSLPFLCEDFRHMMILVMAIGATANIKVKVSNSDDVPNFANPSTVTNQWYYVDLKGLGDGAVTVVGTTGLTLTTSTSQRGYAVNIDEARWIAFDLESISVGSVSVAFACATND